VQKESFNTVNFPPVSQAALEPNGLLAMGGDLSVATLLTAYQAGIFPWYNEGEPILWWSPDPRMVLKIDDLKVRKSLSKVLRNTAYHVTCDQAFAQVITACRQIPRVGQAGTWLQPEVVQAYCALHEAGYAHSFETWENGVLVGGFYGVAIGLMFYGESMFHLTDDASKKAFFHGVSHLQRHGFQWIDCQMHTDYLASFGAKLIPRADLITHLSHAIMQTPSNGVWQFEHRNLV
jgi:leucyl/phenylalanyl-tRNA--protein transferase